MKNYFVLLAILIAPYSLFSQTYVNAYDAYDAPQGTGYSYHSNAKNELGAVEGNQLRSYLYMFKATKDLKYLNEFVIHAKRVIERRDDNINNIQSDYGTSSLGYPVTLSVSPSCIIPSDDQIVNGNRLNCTSKAWSDVEDFSTCTYYCQVPQQTGGICYPLSLFGYCLSIKRLTRIKYL